MMTLETLNEELGQKITQEIGKLGERLERKFDSKIDALDIKVGSLDSKIDALDVKFETKIDALSEMIDEKIDDLAAMTARGFQEVNERLLVIEEKVDVIEEKIDVIEENYVTKDDLMALEEHFESRFITV